jgi:hypothetical protein
MMHRNQKRAARAAGKDVTRRIEAFIGGAAIIVWQGRCSHNRRLIEPDKQFDPSKVTFPSG